MCSSDLRDSFGVVAQLRLENLDRDVAAEIVVERAVHARHATLAKQLFELVSAREELAGTHLVRRSPALGERSAEGVFPDVQRLGELGIGDHERYEHTDDIAVEPAGEEQ